MTRARIGCLAVVAVVSAAQAFAQQAPAARPGAAPSQQYVDAIAKFIDAYDKH